MTLFSLLTLSLFSIPSFAKDQPLPTATNVDINRYVGKWYAISSLPHVYTITCRAQTAEYEILGPSKISVLNTCIQRFGTRTIDGVATVVNTDTNAELEVQFDTVLGRVFNMKGDYTIIKLSEDYDTVMVGSKDRDSLWIMSRTPTIDEAVYDEYVKYASFLNFKVNRLIRSEF